MQDDETNTNLPEVSTELSTEVVPQEVETGREITNEDKERAYRLWKKHDSTKMVADKVGVSTRTVQRWKNNLDWQERKDKENALALRMQNSTDMEIAQDNLRELSLLLSTAINNLRDVIGSPEELVRYRAAVKDYGTLLTNVIKATQTIKGNDGNSNNSTVHTDVKVDINALLELELKAKAQGLDFNAKEALRELRNVSKK